MTSKQFKYIYLSILLALCVTTISRGYYLKHHTNDGNPFERAFETLVPDGLLGINHAINDSLSDLQETKKMERTIERFMDRWEIKGASFAVMKDGKLLYSKGFGIADSASGDSVNVGNIFRIASLSKLITATGIMKLWEDGKLSLDQKVFGEKGILNDSAFLDIKDPRIREITVEHLLRHQGGFSTRAGDPLFCMPAIARSRHIDHPMTVDDMVQFAASTRLRFRPGAGNAYSNLGYVVLGKVIEKVSGMPYETYIQDSILKPIGCYDMHIGYSEADKHYPNEVHYYEPSDAEPVECYDGSGRMVPRSYGGSDLQILGSAGGWVASPTELMKFITAIDPNDSKPNILKPATIAYMTERDTRKFPIGWMRTTAHNDWSRTGSLAGSSAMLKRQSNGYTWVFITNTSSWSGSRFPNKIGAMIRTALNNVKDWPDRDLFINAANTSDNPVLRAEVGAAQHHKPTLGDEVSSKASKL